jgi:hypothetical protein
MQFGRDFQMRLQRAATLKAYPWVSAIAIVAGGIVARVLVYLAPTSGHDVEKAKALGIVSVSILAGHSKSAESFAYFLAMTGAIATSLAIWISWAQRASRIQSKETTPVPWTVPRTTPLEFFIVAVIAFAAFGHFWNGRAATFSAWSTLSEEGEMLAWVDTVLRGGALWRDTFCLYGPISVWSVAALFSLFHPSLGLWRFWIFALNPPALIAAYFLLRGTTRTRVGAAGGAVAFALFCAPAIPAMSWSLLRVGLGLAAIAALTRALDRDKTGWFIGTGALLGTALLYSQEVGIACGLAVGLALILQPNHRMMSILWTAFGYALVLVPAVIYLAATDSLSATVDNLFLFPRIRMLGFAAFPFPSFAFNPESLRAYFVPAVLVAAGFLIATKLLFGLRDARAFTELALFIFGALLFGAALSRPDNPHFAFVAPPALMLLAGLVETACFALGSQNHRVIALEGLAIVAIALTPWTSMAQETLRSLTERPSGRTLALPRGGSALLPDDFATNLEQVTRTIQSRTAPNEPFWVFPNEALLYFLADRPQPTHFPLVIFAITRIQREQLIADLERTRPRWAIVYRDAAEDDGIPSTIARPEVVAYLNAHYEVDSTIGAFALMRRTN